MKNIVVLTDFSDNSVTAYRYGVQVACQLNANILVIFSTNGQAISVTGKTRYSQVLHSFAKRYACDGHAKNNPNNTECLLLEESWVTAIEGVIKARQPDLVIAGSALLNELETNGAALNLQVFAGCPLIWVPEKAIYKPFKNLVLVTDFTDQEPEVTQQVKAFAATFQASLTLVHFYSKTDRARLAQIKKQGLELQRILGDQLSGTSLIEEEDMIEGLEDFAEKNPVDLFLLATRDTHLAHHYFLPVYKKINGCQTQIPVLNYYQEKKNPCAGNCLFCHEPNKPETAEVHA